MLLWLWQFTWRLARRLVVAALVASLPMCCVWLIAFDRDRTLAGHHGTMTMRDCRHVADQWQCHGSFRSDDGEIKLSDVDALFGKEDPGNRPKAGSPTPGRSP
jgi:hypothetical protein